MLERGASVWNVDAREQERGGVRERDDVRRLGAEVLSPLLLGALAEPGEASLRVLLDGELSGGLRRVPLADGTLAEVLGELLGSLGDPGLVSGANEATFGILRDEPKSVFGTSTATRGEGLTVTATQKSALVWRFWGL